MTKNTKAYPIYQVKFCPVADFETVPDIMTGGDRRRRYALVLSISGIPKFSEQPLPIILPSDLDTILIDGDTLDDLEERTIYEVKAMITQMRELEKQKEKENGSGTKEAIFTTSSPVLEA